jgi:Zn-dependent protease with chaperone function
LKYPIYYFFSMPDAAPAYARLGKIHIAVQLAQFLDKPELAAVIAHEEGHLAGQHWLPWMFAVALKKIGCGRLGTWLNHRSEFAADAYAVKRGHGGALQVALIRMHNPAFMDAETFEHPSTNERLRRIRALDG